MRCKLAGHSKSTKTAMVTSMELGRVKGYVDYGDRHSRCYRIHNFDVKHTDKGFSVGSGSAKVRFVFPVKQAAK